MDFEHFSDPLDVASRDEIISTENAVREQRKLAVPQQIPDAAGNFKITECVACGEDIGSDRLRVAIKNLYCIVCATAQEKGRR
jgi:RNA polymerase-binding transcription factor DksA